MKHTNSKRTRRLLGSVAAVSLVLAACGSDDEAVIDDDDVVVDDVTVPEDDSAGPEVSTAVEDIAEADDDLLDDNIIGDDPLVALAGEEVTVSGAVTTLTDPTLFTIGSDDGDVVVLSADGLPDDADEGTVVQVTGTVKEVLVETFDTDFGFVYDPLLYSDYENRLAIDADDVVVLEGSGEEAGPLAGNADIAELNSSTVEGAAAVTLEGTELSVTLSVENVTPGQSHPLHLHLEPDMVSQCPDPDTFLDLDLDGDTYVSEIEGVASYGSLYLALTLDGDTTPESGVDLDRFPTADDDGRIEYDRTLELDQAAADFLAEQGTMTVVVHGQDLDESGLYDGDLLSSIDPELPLEATLPVACGAIELT